MAPKSIFRRPGAQHFQLVHRSQRDPLIHDPEASQHVLKPFRRENEFKKGQSRADLESALDPSELAHDIDRENIGQAAMYGVYFDDTDYDYMQHLRDPDEKEDGMDTIMLPAPTTAKKGKERDIAFRLPDEVLPSVSELNRSQAYDSQQAIPDAIAGFQPDMDPHLRQVLEALEEDAFVDEGLDDDFFQELVKDGERPEDEPLEFEFREEGVEDGAEVGQDEGETVDDADAPWEVRFARFKKDEKRRHEDREQDGSEVDEEVCTETADTVGRLPVIGGKRRRKGAGSASSGFSMTSSAVYRNAGLSLLDEKYEQFEKSYEEDEDDMPSDGSFSDSDVDSAPDLIAARDDFEAVMDDFLENYELVGRRMRQVLPGDNAAEKLDTIRRGLGEIRINPGAEEEEGDEAIPMPFDIDEKRERWDCETILTTYTNLENHPRLIRAKDLETKAVPKIKLDPKTGLPFVQQSASHQRQEKEAEADSDEEEEYTDDDRPSRTTITRPRNETKEEKKARKQAVKQERQARRSDKKATKDQFSTERKHMVKVLTNRPAVVKKL
ncbi:LTV-domain-containing protein [Hysterangium stoloniferum]|nr:LTV-domain-containing protein [Hysterangium stoloniferum]